MSPEAFQPAEIRVTPTVLKAKEEARESGYQLSITHTDKNQYPVVDNDGHHVSGVFWYDDENRWGVHHKEKDIFFASASEAIAFAHAHNQA